MTIQEAWCEETRAPGSSTHCRSAGQCAVTALVVQDLFGGELARAFHEGVSHYWNILSDGTHVDLTRDQFLTEIPSFEIAYRSRLLEGDRAEKARTRERYELLRAKLGLTS